jgi:NADH dehydrogenase (ubiquinone) 1 alpha subcomplex subunit 9
LSPRNFDYNSVHVAGAERIASIAAKSGATRFVHVSHLNASLDSKSKFYQSKAEGEERVKSAFPNATIVRPATMFGYEDKLLNNIAGMFFIDECSVYASRLYESVAYLVEIKSWRDED